jgi:thymidylate synthase
MLDGRFDVAGPARYAKNMLNYSDDGVTLHDAYGHRWRNYFGRNQLNPIITQLKQNPLDRQCVLQMWDPVHDLGRRGKAVPCNLTATFQVDSLWNKLDLVVFCRSNDIIWGTYGANAVHFSFLLEYVALRIGIPVGRYSQISVNFHAYEEPFKKCLPLIDEHYMGYPYPVIPMPDDVELHIHQVLKCADEELYVYRPVDRHFFKASCEWAEMCHRMMWAHQMYRQGHHDMAFEVLLRAPECDWTAAGLEWLHRRKFRREVGANE